MAPSGRAGRFVTQLAGHASYRAFVPAPLPPVPPIDWSHERHDLLEIANRGVGRLDGSEPHNRFVFEGLHEYLTNALDHYTERTIEDHFKKFNNFTTLAARERGKTKQTVRWTDLTMRPLFTFWKYYVRRQGFRDGVRGLIISVFASMYTFVKYAKLWDVTRRAVPHPETR